MSHGLTFHKINIGHIPVVNSWRYNNGSSYVEELTERFAEYVSSQANYYAWLIFLEDVPISHVSCEIDEQIACISNRKPRL